MSITPYSPARRIASKDDVAKICCMHPVSLMKRARTDPDFPQAIKLGAKVFFDLDEIDAWVERQRVPKREPGAAPDPADAKKSAHLVTANRAKRRVRA